MGYCTVADIEGLARSNFSDRNIQDAIEAATVRINEETGRVWEASSSETRVFEAQRDGFCLIDDLISASSVMWDESAIDEDNYSFKPGGTRAPKWAIAGPWYEETDVTITGLWGSASEVPADLREACVEWVVRTIKRADQGFTDASAVPELGQMIYNKPMPPEIWRIMQRRRRVTPR